jgi:hypothetical protein
MEHVPVAATVTVAPLTVQTLPAPELNATGSPEEEVAAMVKGGAPATISGNGANTIELGVERVQLEPQARETTCPAAIASPD